MLLINVFMKRLMEKVKNTKNFTIISGALFLRLTCSDTKSHTKKNSHRCLPDYIAKHNYNFTFNKVHK